MAKPTSNDTIKLFATDLDGTLLGNPETTERFCESWASIHPEKRPLLVYNSGRLVEDIVQQTAAVNLPTPDFIIGGLGTEIVDFSRKAVLDDYLASIQNQWDVQKVAATLSVIPGLQRQSETLQTAFKSCWTLQTPDPSIVEAARQALTEAGLDVSAMSHTGLELNVLPKGVSKGGALQWLLKHCKLAGKDILVAGDSGYDISMFEITGARGIIVANAQPELFEACVKLPVHHAEHVFADGVVEGLAHYALIHNLPAAHSIRMEKASAADTELSRLFKGDNYKHVTDDEKRLILEGYDQGIDCLKRCITPLGFTACSIEDNETTGTDENYHSVWARDGGVTVICASRVNDPELRAASRQTLVTLLDAMTENGQLPANVQVSTQVPDYSGVGGICSIDSALWVIMACYHYVNTTDDHEFLDTYMGHIKRAMFWLWAHDSNNDYLLEIPEASDWTDLFGRSYQVLYDEVLWYRCNICFAHILEFNEEFEEAAKAFSKSQKIQAKLLATFWPSTQPNEDPAFARTFADRQYSLGDVQYLLAEVTPFNFSWRCDVYGNVLAFITNLIDVGKARTAFKFMWGAGVNQPWPVANLYPVVQSGDPDWRPYYTVNLLNLPHHYHNGGIWPLIGGMWVRFIHRLGQHETALKELVRLAELCKQGRAAEWEFNEWFHGQTGMPMGKAYQAWSAASYIRACHELDLVEDTLPMTQMIPKVARKKNP